MTGKKCYNSYEPEKGINTVTLNFNMAGTIIERVSGERFDHYVLNHILKPLKLYGGYNVNELNQNLLPKFYELVIDSAKFILFTRRL